MNIKDWRGIRSLVAAELKTDTTAAITWGTPFPVCAVSKLTKNTESSTASKHYSNRAALHRRSRGADEVSIDASGITDATRARIMGEVYDEALGMYVAGNPGARLLALGYIIKDTNGVEWGVWRLKGAMSYPETEHNTEDDGSESAGETLTYTGQHTNHKFKHRGKPAKAVRIPLAAFPGGEAAFFAQVQTPDTVAAAMAGGDSPAPVDEMYLYGTPSETGNIGLRSGESVTYYKGAVLQKLPEWVKGFKTAMVSLTWAQYIVKGFNEFTAGQTLMSNGEYYPTIEAESYSYSWYEDNNGKWEDEIRTGKNGGGYQSEVIWTTTDLYTVGGELTIAATDPIPVGEIVDTIDGVPIYEDLR